MAVFGKETGDNTQKAVYDLINRVNENIRRMRVIEQQIKAMNIRLNSIEQNIMGHTRATQKSLKERDTKISKLEDRALRLETMTKEIVKQMKGVATKANVEEVKTMLNIYNPIESSFMTRDEVEQLVNQKLSKKG